jgi:SAM-dependent methyltransferase
LSELVFGPSVIGHSGADVESSATALQRAVIASAAIQSSYPSPTRLDLLKQVGATSADNYLYGGLTTAAGIRAVAESLGSPLSKTRRVLDWGCSSGRVIRWLGDIAAGTELVGTDINDIAVRWCQKNLPFASVHTNGPLPPLPFPDEHFDLIFGISVVSHLDQDYERAWLRELWRVARPGALVLLSVHGEDWAAQTLSPSELDEFGRRGFLYKRVSHASLEGLPDFYQLAFHSRRYIERSWTGLFEVVSYLKHGPLYAQQLVAMRKTTVRPPWLRPAQGERVEVDLPMGALDWQAVGSFMSGPSQPVTGWAFFPSGKSARLRLWLDGRPVAEGVADLRRSDVAAIFPRFPTAGRSGFALSIDTRGLAPGQYALWLTSDDSEIPIGTTYFGVR